MLVALKVGNIEIEEIEAGEVFVHMNHTWIKTKEGDAMSFKCVLVHPDSAYHMERGLVVQRMEGVSIHAESLASMDKEERYESS